MEQLGRGAREMVAEGYGRGRVAGRAEGLTRLLQYRFNGDLTPKFQQRIAAASLAELDLWFERSTNAPSLDAVFKR